MRMIIRRGEIGVILEGNIQGDILTCNLTLNVADGYTLYLYKEDDTITKFTCDILEDLGSSYPKAQYKVKLSNMQQLQL